MPKRFLKVDLSAKMAALLAETERRSIEMLKHIEPVVLWLEGEDSVPLTPTEFIAAAHAAYDRDRKPFPPDVFCDDNSPGVVYVAFSPPMTCAMKAARAQGLSPYRINEFDAETLDIIARYELCVVPSHWFDDGEGALPCDCDVDHERTTKPLSIDSFPWL